MGIRFEVGVAHLPDVSVLDDGGGEHLGDRGIFNCHPVGEDDREELMGLPVEVGGGFYEKECRLWGVVGGEPDGLDTGAGAESEFLGYTPGQVDVWFECGECVVELGCGFAGLVVQVGGESCGLFCGFQECSHQEVEFVVCESSVPFPVGFASGSPAFLKLFNGEEVLFLVAGVGCSVGEGVGEGGLELIVACVFPGVGEGDAIGAWCISVVGIEVEIGGGVLDGISLLCGVGDEY